MSHKESPFGQLAELPRDPILGLTEAYNADKAPHRVNLGVGVYQDEHGKVPLLACVKQAEQALLAKAGPHTYVPIDGYAHYNAAVARMVFAQSCELANVATVQALGGTGALKLGAELIKVISPRARGLDQRSRAGRTIGLCSRPPVSPWKPIPITAPMASWISPDWLTHWKKFRPAMRSCCMPAAITRPGSTCRRINGGEIARIVRARNLIPFLDTAYMGFAEGLEADAFSVRLFASDGGPLFVSFSFSKSLSLYGERVGALSVLTAGAQERARVLSQLKRIARITYSSPPGHGAAAASAVLADPALRKLWDEELGAMRVRIKKMRQLLADSLTQRIPGRDFSYIVRQNGMFSYSRLTKLQAVLLREKYSVYALDSGRICVAALNEDNIGHVAECIAKVMKEA